MSDPGVTHVTHLQLPDASCAEGALLTAMAVAGGLLGYRVRGLTLLLRVGLLLVRALALAVL